MECLICKKDFKNLPTHLKWKHDLNSDQYRKKFNLGLKNLRDGYYQPLVNLSAKSGISIEEVQYMNRGRSCIKNIDKFLADKKRSEYLRKRRQEQKDEMGREALSDRRS